MSEVDRIQRKGKFTELKGKFRKVITGDAKRRLRDYVKEEPDYVKLLDKLFFTFGLLNILASQYFILKIPSYFWIWYTIVMPILLFTRIFHFKNLGWQYFLLDFCYFVLLLTFVNLYLLPDYHLLFKVCFIYVNGPVTGAIVVWRNSLVFHDYDKVTSVYIHLLPAVLYYAARWHGNDSIMQKQNNSTLYNDIADRCTFPGIVVLSSDNLQWIDFLVAALGYLFWQSCYYAKTEIVDKEKLDAQPELLTSLRWMSTDKKNLFTKMVLKFCRKVGIFGRNEVFDAFSIKTKMVFIIAQFLYSLLTFGPAYLAYNSQYCHIFLLLFIFSMAAFNGASFYIEVFSKVYQLKIEKLQEVSRLAKLATAETKGEISESEINQKIKEGIDKVQDDYTDVSLSPSPSPGIDDY